MSSGGICQNILAKIARELVTVLSVTAYCTFATELRHLGPNRSVTSTPRSDDRAGCEHRIEARYRSGRPSQWWRSPVLSVSASWTFATKLRHSRPSRSMTSPPWSGGRMTHPAFDVEVEAGELVRRGHGRFVQDVSEVASPPFVISSFRLARAPAGVA